MDLTELRADKRVAAGVELFQSKGVSVDRLREVIFPQGFVDCAFDVHDDFQCPLGRMFGAYHKGLEALGINFGNAPSFGFEVDDDDTDLHYYHLTEAWERALIPENA